jgi:hypothetical protein
MSAKTEISTQRIDAGVRNGSLTRREAVELRA